MWGAVAIIVVVIVFAVIGWVIYKRTHGKSSQSDTLIGSVRNVRLEPHDAFVSAFYGQPHTAGFVFTWDPPTNGSGAGYSMSYSYSITDPSGDKTPQATVGSNVAFLPTPLKDGTYAITIAASNQFGTGPSATFNGTLDLKPQPFPANAIRVSHPTTGYYFERDAVPTSEDAMASVSYVSTITDPSGKQYHSESAATRIGLPQPIVSGRYQLDLYAKNEYSDNATITGSTNIAKLAVRSVSARWVASSANDGAYALNASAIIENLPAATTPHFSLSYPDGSGVYLAPGTCGTFSNVASTCSPNSDGIQTCASDMQPVYGSPNLSSLLACTAIGMTNKSMRNMPVNLKVDVVPQNALIALASMTMGTVFPGTAPARVTNGRIAQHQ
ncbi:uncharacterized protein ACA1_020480 [Acanthamoeba castellanii str. Neff]|uniref:Fibronectin type III domain containing protein n=1 Tax=Acanthamoeba castellanii (strain ATCC 30010 / Neff) TaxID=1257118 RepID=L8GVP3_ACACF|nr:uncharacterized protein ACA1_020480 [Acanthamoeba castellanii str. Neff]ELR17012.1 hypothetical protein ACA1_020480 [Acanthamoeba castellanii str. Neff]